MKQTITIILFFFIAGNTVFAQCKPDQATKDRITKEEIKVWGLEIVKVSLAEKLIDDQNTTFPTIEAMIGTFGDRYVMRFNLIIVEKSKEKAYYAQHKEGNENSEVLVGFKEEGQPLKLKVDEATNDQKVNRDGSFMSVIALTINFDKEGIEKVKEVLTTKTIDGIRFTLAGNKKMEGTVRDKKGEKLKEKFICFYDFIGSNK